MSSCRDCSNCFDSGNRACIFLSYLLRSHDSRVSFCLFRFANKLTNLARVPECHFRKLDVSRRLWLLSASTFRLKTTSLLFATKPREANVWLMLKRLASLLPLRQFYQNWNEMQYHVRRSYHPTLENVFACPVIGVWSLALQRRTLLFP